MKKKLLIAGGIVLAVALIVVAAVLLFSAPPMLSQPMENVYAVTLKTNYNEALALAAAADETGEAIDPSVSTPLHQKADMYTAYNAISKCSWRRTVNAKNKQLAGDTKAFAVVIEYKDGQKDVILAGAEPGYIYRCINPDAPQEKQKFVLANSDLQSFIDVYSF